MEAKVEKSWFEMRPEIRRPYASAVWIPLRSEIEVEDKKYGELGYRAELTAVRSVAVHLAQRDKVEHLNWAQTHHDHGVYTYDGHYKPAEVHQQQTGEDLGIELVLDQHFGGLETRIWYLNQDIVFALRLLREGDVWVCPAEGYVEVARLTRDVEGHESSLLIRSEFLKDYLSARSMALRLFCYRSRQAILEDCSHIGWTTEGCSVEIFGGRFEGRAWDIHQGGEPFGAEAAVIHMFRTDFDFDEDVPTLAPDDENTASNTWNVRRSGRKLCRVEGQYWRNEWIEPAPHSVRVRGDQIPSAINFITGAAGERVSADSLKCEEVGRWLWFSPQIVVTILGRRGSSLEWFTRDTAGLELAGGSRVHFGVNENDLVTAYAFDVARLPEWQRLIWAGFNVAPNGGVSRELLGAQVDARPAPTQAPERFLGRGLIALNAAFQARWGMPLRRQHEEAPNIIARAHRFRALDKAGLLSLAKDLARLTADSFDLGVLRPLVPVSEKLVSLKLLEQVLATLVGDADAHRIVGPLVGVYDLRLGDAHLPSGKILDALRLVDVDANASWLQKGTKLLSATVSAIYAIADVLASGPSHPI